MARTLTTVLALLLSASLVSGCAALAGGAVGGAVGAEAADDDGTLDMD